MRAAEHLENTSPLHKQKATEALKIAKGIEARKLAKGATYVDAIVNGIPCKVLRKE